MSPRTSAVACALAAAAILLSAIAPVRAAERLTARVDPFVGTGGHGHTYPGASLPFGMVQVSPDTRLEGWDGCSGYHYSDSRVYGFSHTHLSGTGVPDYCDILLMPGTGDVRLENGAGGGTGYASAFSHEREQAEPGYYAVTLDDYDVRAELTATLRAGMHRYTFPEGRSGHVLVDLAHRDEVIESEIRIVGDREIEGMRRSRGWATNQYVYFVARFSRPFSSASVAVDGKAGASLREARGKRLEAVAEFGDEGGPVVVKVGISAVDVAGARKNLDAEIPGWDFDAVRRDASAAWERELSKIVVEGGTESQQRVFYTALYHAMLSPNLFVDVDGRYRGRDLAVHQTDSPDNYTVFSLWDTFRALHPLLTIVDTHRTAEFVRTFIRQYEQGGRLPVWELAGNETDCMIGYHSVSVIADAVRKKIGGFDVRRAYEAMKHSAEENRRGLDSYKRLGYVAGDQEPESVSKTLEYAYDDWCIALVAEELGEKEEAARYMRRAQNYKNLFDPSVGFMRARQDGVWFSPFDPAEVNFNYTEANAWQYSFFVPQDVAGLIALEGGRDAFTRKLDALFTADSELTGRQQDDITGLIGQYAHGNEPSHHVAYLYAMAGQPWKTQALVRRIMDTMYTDRPDGLAGNEDCGQMSAWLVLSALGFYEVAPGSNQYVIGTPLFPKATIRLESGRTFTVLAPGVSESAFYVQGAELDGKPYGKCYLDHATIAAGGTLTLRMGERPNTSWAVRPEDEATTAIAGPKLVPTPFVSTGAVTFPESTRVTLGTAEPVDEIRYTLDGSEPTTGSALYRGPIDVATSTTVRAVALRGGVASAVLVASFHKIPEGRAVRLSAPPAPEYRASGDATLVDGLRGGPDFRLGRWQGFQMKDLVVDVDLGREEPIRRLAMGFLQDTGSWVLMPQSVTFAVSDNGHAYTEIGTVRSDVDERDYRVQTKDFALDLTPREARYVRVRVEGHGALPPWHLGAGHASWIFADEVVVE